eukprot:m.87460 g.87460  ORF g.87460 m.87460 type:complete len:404 (+) comp26075_c0_seq1:1343-2554(+)
MMSTELFSSVGNKYTLWSPGSDWRELTGVDATYKPFHRFVHATHLDVAIKILEDGKISSQPVNDTSRLTSNRQLVPHVVWLAPDIQEDNSFGPTTFHLPPSAVDLEKCKFFFVETVDYAKSEMSSRILVVPHTTPATVIPALRDLLDGKLREYNPKTEKGPFKINDDGTLETLVKGLPHRSQQARHHTTEFVILGDVSFSNRELDPYPERDCQFVYLSTNTHSGNWCKKKGTRCGEKDTTLTMVVDAIGKLAGKCKISIVNNEQRFDAFLTKHNTSLPEEDTRIPSTSPPSKNFAGWNDIPSCKTVCTAVNGSFASGSSALHELTTLLKTTQLSLTSTQWKAVLASFTCYGPVKMKTSANQLHGNTEYLHNLIGGNADKIFSSLEKEPTFLTWFCKEIQSQNK